MTAGITLGILFGIGLGFLIDNATAGIIVGASCGAAAANWLYSDKTRSRENKSR